MEVISSILTHSYTTLAISVTIVLKKAAWRIYYLKIFKMIDADRGENVCPYVSEPIDTYYCPCALHRCWNSKSNAAQTFLSSLPSLNPYNDRTYRGIHSRMLVVYTLNIQNWNEIINIEPNLGKSVENLFVVKHDHTQSQRYEAFWNYSLFGIFRIQIIINTVNQFNHTMDRSI